MIHLLSNAVGNSHGGLKKEALVVRWKEPERVDVRGLSTEAACPHWPAAMGRILYLSTNC